MKYLDRAKASGRQIKKAIAQVFETGETLTITEDGVPRVQIVIPQPVRCFCSVCEDEEIRADDRRTPRAKDPR